MKIKPTEYIDDRMKVSFFYLNIRLYILVCISPWVIVRRYFCFTRRQLSCT